MTFRKSLLGVVLAAAVWLLPIPGLAPEAHRLLTIMVLVISFWVTEAAPLWMTALLGCALCLAAGSMPAQTLLQSFADPILFLFIGSFLLAKAMHLHGLDNRVAHALVIHPWVGGNSHRTLWAFALVAWGLAMWLSITTTVAMLLPAALVLARMAEKSDRRYAAALLLILPYAASAGAMASPVGTPPNLIGIAFIKEILGQKIEFFQWMVVGLPVALAILVVRYLIVIFLLHPPTRAASQKLQHMSEAFHKPGTWSQAERITLVCFAVTVIFWMIGFPPGVVAMTASALLFILPAGAPSGERILRGRDALTIDWGTVVLFGGGIALGRAMFDTGLGAFLGHAWLEPLLAGNFQALILVTVLVASVFSTIASNTAAANVVIPLVLSIVGQDRAAGLSLAFAATFGTSLGLALPVSTPANAMVYGSKLVRLRDMVWIGILVDAACIPIVWIAAGLVPLLFR